MRSNKLIAIILAAIGFIFIFAAVILMNNKNEIVTYQVTFNSNGGTSVETQIINEGDKVSKPVDPTREGYIFVEWQLDGKIYDFNQDVTSDLTLAAKWVKIEDNKETYVIKFNSDGGTAISNQVIEKGNTVTKPDDPIKEGYIFKGWFLEDKAYDFNSKVEKRIELTAKWERIIYTVTFNSDGGNSISSQTVVEGNKVTKPTNPTKNDYTFVEWQLDGKTYDFNSKVTKNIELKAVWKKINKYTVTFNTDGGSSVPSQTVVEGNKATKPSVPIKEGYNFNGWTLNGNNYDFNASVTGNITLSAKWTQKNYTVVARKVDMTAPFSRVLTVYEDGVEKVVKTIQYTDGVTICSGTNPNVNYYAINEETELKLVLNSGTVVTAKLTIEV